MLICATSPPVVTVIWYGPNADGSIFRYATALVLLRTSRRVTCKLGAAFPAGPEFATEPLPVFEALPVSAPPSPAPPVKFALLAVLESPPPPPPAFELLAVFELPPPLLKFVACTICR